MVKSKYREEEQPLPTHAPKQIVVPVPKDLEDDDLSLKEPSCRSRVEFEAELADHKLPMTDADHEEIQRTFVKRRRRQFSVRELFVMMTVFTIGLSLVNWLPREVFGFVMGLGGLVSLIAGCTLPTKSRLLNIQWCTLLFLYLIAVILILVETTRGS